MIFFIEGQFFVYFHYRRKISSSASAISFLKIGFKKIKNIL